MAGSPHDRLVGSSDSRDNGQVSRTSRYQRTCKIQHTRLSEGNGGQGRLYVCRSLNHSQSRISNKRWRSDLWHKAVKQILIQILNSAAFLVHIHGRRMWVSLKWLKVTLEVCFLLHISWQTTLIESEQTQQQSLDPRRKLFRNMEAFCLREEATNGRVALSVILLDFIEIGDGMIQSGDLRFQEGTPIRSTDCLDCRLAICPGALEVCTSAPPPSSSFSARHWIVE